MQGYIYVALGEKYRRQFEKSVKFLKEYNNQVNVTVITDQKDESLEKADKIIEKPELNLGLPYKAKTICWKETPYEKTIALDTDTIVCGETSELFDMLERFDVIAGHAPYRLWSCDSERIPEPFVQFNTGVVGFDNKLLSHIDRVVDKMGSDCECERSQQPPFREVVYNSDLETYVLPTEYNFRSKFLAYAQQPIKIIHDAELLELSYPKIQQRILRVNQKPFTPRAWHPERGMIFGKTTRDDQR